MAELLLDIENGIQNSVIWKQKLEIRFAPPAGVLNEEQLFSVIYINDHYNVSDMT